MDIFSIVNEPTVVDGIHESLFRSYHILNAVEWLLENNTQPEVVLAIMRGLRNAPHVERETSKPVEVQRWFPGTMGDVPPSLDTASSGEDT